MLGMSHLSEARTDRFRDLSIVEEGSEFILRGGCHYIAKGLAFGVEGSIWRRLDGGLGGVGGAVTEYEVATRAAASVFD